MTSTRRRGTRRHRTRWLSGVVGVLGLAAAAAWLGWTALKARADLEAASASLPAVKSAVLSGDAAGARGRIAELDGQAGRAYARTHDPVWAVAARVPLLGRPLATTRAITEAVRGVSSDVLAPLSQVASSARPEQLINGGTVNLQALRAASPALQQASVAVDRERERLERAPQSWLPVVSSARAELLVQLAPLSHTLGTAERASRLLPSMLGQEGPRRYFLGFQNPAEARGTGGLLDAYAVVVADHGKVAVERIGSNAQLPSPKGPLERVSQDFLDRYGVQGATYLWVNTNLSPDFSEVGPVWLEMWRMATGEQLDGAIAVDPAALAKVLSATGPVSAPGVGPVDATSVEQLVTQRQYQVLGESTTRKTLMVGVGQAAVESLLSGRAQPRALIDALTAAAQDRHLTLYSRHTEEQEGLHSGRITGEVPDTAAPFAQAVVVNTAGSKLDAYLDQSLDYRVASCGRERRTASVTVTLDNSAPGARLPDYVTLRADQPQPTVPVGQNRVDLQVLLTRGARVISATLDQRSIPVAPPDGGFPSNFSGASITDFLGTGTEAGRPSYGLELELPVDSPRVLTLTVEEPPSTVAPVLPVQNLARTPRVTSEVSACRGL